MHESVSKEVLRNVGLVWIWLILITVFCTLSLAIYCLVSWSFTWWLPAFAGLTLAIACRYGRLVINEENRLDGRTVRPKVPCTEPPVIVFASPRLAALHALRHGINTDRLRLATEGVESLHGVGKSCVVVQFPPEVWQPGTNLRSARVEETQQAIKRLHEKGVVVHYVYSDVA